METDSNKVFIWANAAGYDFFGDDVIGREVADYFVGEQDTYRVVKPVFDGQENTVYVESLQRRKDGQDRLLAWWCRGLKDEAGNTVGALSTARDITQERRHEAALRKNRTMLARTESISHIGSWEWDAETNRATWSDELFRIFGREPSEGVPSSVQECQLYHPDDMEQVHKAVEAALKEGKPYELELRAIRSDGVTRVCVARGISERAGDGRVIRLFGSVQDVTERKNAEAELRLHGLVLAQTRDCVVVTDLDGVITYVNEAVVKGLGYSRDELIGTSVGAFGEDPERGGTQEGIIEETLRDGEWRGEVVNRTADGRELIMDCHIQLVRDEDGNPVALCGISADITERKKAEAALQEANLRYRATVRGGNIGLWDWDLAANKVHFSTEWKAQIGYEEVEITDDFEEWRRRVHPDDLSAALEAVNKAIDECRNDFEVEFRFRHKDGSWRWIASRGSVLTDDMGQAVRFVGSHVDVTERKQAEEMLRRERDLSNRIIEDSPLGVTILDAEGTIVLANRQAEEILGLTESEMAGRKYNAPEWRIADTDGRPFPDGRMPFRLVMATGRPVHDVEHSITWPDGKSRILSISASPLFDARGQVERVVCVIDDTTERRSLDAQLRRAQRMEAVGQLAGGVAHDFNNILQAMLSRISFLLDEHPEGDDSHEDLMGIKRGAKRAADLVRQLLAFSRRQVLDLKVVDLNEVTEDLLKMLRRVIGEDIGLKFIPGPGLGAVDADKGQIEQVLTNLCVNARDAMPEGGTITIETENVVIDSEYCETHPWAKMGRYASLVVADSGMGMDEETQKRVFDPFFTTKPVDKGTGLGLATVYGIIAQHEGMIQVYSELGRGSVFKIYLPVTERRAVEVKQEAVSQVVGGTETILLAEDDRMVREMTARVLRRAGYTVMLASNGREAVDVFDAHGDEVALAILDVVMPEMGGRQVYEHIKALRPGMKVLFSSGYSEDAIHTRFVLDEGVQLIQKPYAPGVLLSRVRTVLDAQ